MTEERDGSSQRDQHPPTGRTRIVLASAVLMLGACSTSHNPTSAGVDTSQTAMSGSSVTSTLEGDSSDAGMRLVNAPPPQQIDLAGNVTSSEIAAVLDFQSGADGYPPCDNYLDGVEEAPEIAPGVGLVTADEGAAVGYLVSLCIRNWPDDTAGRLVLPSGSTVPLPAAESTSTYGRGVEIFREAAYTPGRLEFRLATFPGAPIGEYRLDLTDGSRTERAPFDVETALERGLPPRHFNFDTYDEDFAVQGNTASMTEVLFGFAGYKPHQSAELLLYRSQSTAADTLVDGPYERTAEVAVQVDDRGEAVVAIALDDSASGHCFRFDTAETLATEVARGGTADAVGNDPTLFCVPSGAAGS